MNRVGKIEKTWGYENIIISNEKYCTKYLAFPDAKPGEPKQTSMHYHMNKDEVWYVIDGKFLVRYIDTRDAMVHEKQLNRGDTWRNRPGFIHQLVALEEGLVLETSTEDDPNDNYRVWR